jgi:hypothetical protein
VLLGRLELQQVLAAIMMVVRVPPPPPQLLLLLLLLVVVVLLSCLLPSLAPFYSHALAWIGHLLFPSSAPSS